MQRSRLCAVLIVLLAVVVSPLFAQFEDRDTLIGLDVGGPVFGIYSGSFEQVLLDDISIYVRGGYENPEYSLLYRESINEEWDLWSIDGQIGANYYPQNLAPEGAYVGVGVRPAFVRVSDGDTEEETFTLGFTTQLGYRFVIGPVVFGPYGRMAYAWAFNPLPDFGDEEILSGFGSGFLLSAGIDVSIAF
ncbi:MAG: hypothetical protein OXP69_16070 [Spirochaetaceae bacterium]|nr:hypothetical protein [Spirochaetaceae bacterium]